jgi:hypothetical protein
MSAYGALTVSPLGLMWSPTAIRHASLHWYLYIPIYNTMLSNFDLEELSEHYGFPLSKVLMKDELKVVPPKSGNFIINLQSSSQGNGTHWVCLAIRGKQSFYCDSFGVLMPQEVITFCKRIPKSHLSYNDFGFQHIKSETCGWYCVGLLIHIPTWIYMMLVETI